MVTFTMVSFTNKNIYISATIDGYFGLERLLENKKKIDVIVILPSKSAKNVSDYKDLSPLAKKFSIPLHTVKHIKELEEKCLEEKPNLIITNGWSQLLSKKLINSTRKGCLGLHPALLPKNRGRAPIAWHFINEEEFGGITLFFLDEYCDHGPIIDQKKFKITQDDNASSYYEKIMQLGSAMLVEHFDAIINGTVKSYPQSEKYATYLLKRRPRDSKINFSNSNRNIHNLIRAVSDVYPLGTFMYKNKPFLVKSSVLGTKLPKYSGLPGQIAKVEQNKIWVIAGDGLIGFTEIYDNGRNQISISDIFKEGDVLNED